MESDLIKLTLKQRKIIEKMTGEKFPAKAQFGVHSMTVHRDRCTDGFPFNGCKRAIKIEFNCIEIIYLKDKKKNVSKTNVYVSRRITNEI